VSRCADCDHSHIDHDIDHGACFECTCSGFENPDQDQTMVDLGGGMVVPLSELMDDDR